MRNSLLFALITLSLNAPIAGRTTVSGIQKSDTQKKDNIRHLMKIMGVEKLTQSMLDQYLQALKPVLAQAPKDDDQKRQRRDRFAEIMSEEFKQVDLIPTYVDIYDKYFTNEEINGLIQFYESPVGKKAIAVLPAITQEGMKRGMELGSTVGEKVLTRLVNEFPDLKSVLQAPARR
jgi:uncharacterized protein